MMFVIVNPTVANRLLTHEGRWSLHAPFGDGTGCAQTYRKVGWARRRARFIRHARVAAIPAGMQINAACNVWEVQDIPGKPEHTRVIRHPIEEFFV